MNKSDIPTVQTLIEKLDLNLITLKDAKNYWSNLHCSKSYETGKLGRTKREFVRFLGQCCVIARGEK